MTVPKEVPIRAVMSWPVEGELETLTRRHPYFLLAAIMAFMATAGILVVVILLQARSTGGCFRRKPVSKVQMSKD
eukprot:s956_g13.t1